LFPTWRGFSIVWSLAPQEVDMSRLSVSRGWWVLCLGFLGLGLGNLFLNPALMARVQAADAVACAVTCPDPTTSAYCCPDPYGGSQGICVPDGQDPPPDCSCACGCVE